MKRLFPVIFLASFAVFADDVEAQPAPEALESVQEAQPEIPEHVQPIEMASHQDAGSVLNGILEHASQLGALLNKAYKATGLSKYISTENVVVASLAGLVIIVGYKKLKTYQAHKAGAGSDDKKKD